MAIRGHLQNNVWTRGMMYYVMGHDGLPWGSNREFKIVFFLEAHKTDLCNTNGTADNAMPAT